MKIYEQLHSPVRDVAMNSWCYASCIQPRYTAGTWKENKCE